MTHKSLKLKKILFSNVDFPQHKSKPTNRSVFINGSVKLLIFLSITVVMDSCSSSLAFQKGIRKYKEPLGYTQNEVATTSPKTDSLTVRLNHASLDSTTTVSLVKKHTLFLLLFASKDLKMNVRLGQSSLQESYKNFFYNSLIKESSRVSCFGIKRQASGITSYALEITLDSCKTNADYEFFMTDLLGFASFNYSGTPAMTKLVVSAKLKKGNKIIEQKRYDITRFQPFVYPQFSNYKEFKAAFMANMAKSLSVATKHCIVKIINDVDVAIQNQNNINSKHASKTQAHNYF